MLVASRYMRAKISPTQKFGWTDLASVYRTESSSLANGVTLLCVIFSMTYGRNCE